MKKVVSLAKVLRQGTVTCVPGLRGAAAARAQIRGALPAKAEGRAELLIWKAG